MTKIIKKIFSSELGKGAFILLITMSIFNILNFLFHFSMGRMLGPEDYRILAVLMSLIYIYSVPTEAIQNIISRYTSKFNLNRRLGKIKFLMFKSLKKGFKVAIGIFLLSIILAFFLSYFLKINFWIILLTNVFIFFAFSSPIPKGVLQGRKKFGLLGINLIIEAGLKLIFAISLVTFGFKIFGAIGGAILGILSGLIFSFYFNKDVLKKEEEKVSFNGIYPKSIPYFITTFVILLTLSLDIILATRFFSPKLAGQYSALSMLGKMIFFGTAAISKAMFPLTSERHDNAKNPFELFKKSFLIILSLCILAIGVYAFLPKFIIEILYGIQYVDMAPYLLYSGLALSFLSLSHIIFVYKLSINKLKKSYYLFIFLIIEIVLLYLFHSNILEYVLAFMVSNIIMFIGSLFIIRK
ncbi:oligosaccharide flippase family protein [Candidatus Pacearchaeota archaeon]|nr:oligosaccharide flippase family protein [Candidatus Pacearchaeota archaeon]